MPAAFRNGDFSSLLPGTVINDPLTGQPFPGNIIPKNALFTGGAELCCNYTPLPDPDGLIHYSLSTQADTSDYVVRGDYRLNDQAQLSWRGSSRRTMRR